MGHSGPAFVAYQNFQVIMRWNRSPVLCASGWQSGRPDCWRTRVEEHLCSSQHRCSVSLITQLQTALAGRGYAVGEADGVTGPATRLRCENTNLAMV